jgi:mannose-6-phosphate isomerase-like protein (cupin superfamily)
LLGFKERFYLLYRAFGDDEVSRIGLAVTDGYRVLERLPDPIFVPQTEQEKKGVEDPRVVIIGDELIMLYTAYDGVIAQIAAASISVDDFINKRFYRWKRKGLAFRDIWDKDAFLFPEKINDKYIIYHRRFQMRLVIAGIIQDEEYYREQVAPELDQQRVVYVGHVGPERRNLMLGGAYALLHPINFAEPFGLSVVESMACGTPVVAFDKGSMPEVIRDQETGFLVKGIDQAVEALGKIPELDRGACRRWVENRFSRERMVNDYLDVYKMILEKEKPGMRYANTPWGRWEVLLDAPDHKVKRITVNPGKRLSYQKHFKRQEHWFMVSGQALVTLDGEDIPLTAGQSVDIPQEAAHRMANPGETPLIFIETQTGSYFGEDDIVRLEDDYGRS